MFVIKLGSIGHASHDRTVNRSSARVRMCVCVYTSARPPKLCHKLIQRCCFDRLTKKLHWHLVLREMWYWHDRLQTLLHCLRWNICISCDVKKKKKRLHAARVFQMITSLMARKSESYWFGFIPVKYLYVYTCVLAVITYRKIDKKQRVNKVKCVVKQTFPQRLGLVCLKVKL